MFALLAKFSMLDDAPEAPPPPSYADLMKMDGQDGFRFMKPGACTNDFPHICSGRGEGVRKLPNISIHA